MNKILNNIRKIREINDISQETMADMLNMSQSAYARFELGKAKTDLSILSKIANKMDMSIIDIITYPKKYVDSESFKNKEETKVTISIELKEETKKKVLELISKNKDLDLI